jgi:hypothetical protein
MLANSGFFSVVIGLEMDFCDEKMAKKAKKSDNCTCADLETTFGMASKKVSDTN